MQRHRVLCWNRGHPFAESLPTPDFSPALSLARAVATPGTRRLHTSLCLSAPGTQGGGGLPVLLSVFSRWVSNRIEDWALPHMASAVHSRAGSLQGSLAASREAAWGTSASPAIQVVTGSLNRLNVEIKANLYEKAVFLLSLNVDSSLDLHASPVCHSSSRSRRWAQCMQCCAREAGRGRPPPSGCPSALQLSFEKRCVSPNTVSSFSIFCFLCLWFT